MLAEERFSLIMEQLDRKRTVTVQELCEALNTSESTIRRDLTELDRQGKLNKVHGGATSVSSPSGLSIVQCVQARLIGSSFGQSGRWLISCGSVAHRCWTA